MEVVYGKICYACNINLLKELLFTCILLITADIGNRIFMLDTHYPL